MIRAATLLGSANNRAAGGWQLVTIERERRAARFLRLRARPGRADFWLCAARAHKAPPSGA